MDDQNRNLILATALSFAVILAWFLLFPPQDTPQPADQDTPASASQTVAGTPAGDSTAPAQSTASGAAPGEAAEAAEKAPRITIDTPRLTGSISLQGGRIDELSLKDYRETLDPDSPLVELLSPVGSDNPYYALFGWAPGGDLDFEDVPGPNTRWQVEGNDTLTTETPVTLSWDNGSGLVFKREMSVDRNYMFTVTQTVENTTGAPVRLAPYGRVVREGEPDHTNFYILHEGVVRMSDGNLQEIKYKNMPELDPNDRWGAHADVTDVTSEGWIGFTDKYWMTTLVPDQSFVSVAQYTERTDTYQTEARLPTQEIAAGATGSSSTRIFAGAKEWETIRAYQNKDGIHGFVDSIDWGWFFFLTKPIFWLLHTLNGFIGNMGFSIIAMTIFLKALLFPLAYKSYVSMAKMKELQPEMEKIKEKAGDDRQKLQQEMMGLYKKHKVNPAAGCLPILPQIPIFFSLYKVIFVTIELRHAPWIGWIHDLSAPDPTSILNLFGLLPWGVPDPSSPLHIISLGVLPIILGFSMWLQQKLNPAPQDPTQAMIFSYMPLVFMFMLGRFASGLVLYWITNNTITFTQQYIIMRSQGYKPDVFGNIRRSFQRKKKTADE